MSSNSFLEALWRRLSLDSRDVFACIRLAGRYEEVTNADMAHRVSHYAASWRAGGVRKGDVVFLILRHGQEMVPAFLAAMWIGAVPSYLPFPSPRQDAAAYWRTHAEVFLRTRARAALTEPDLAEKFRELASSVPDMAILVPGTLCAAPALQPPISVGLDEVALLQHSSGTTGLKKGVALTYRSIAEQLDAYAETLQLDSKARIATWLPLYHDMGLIACFLLPAYLGIPVVSIDAFEWVLRPELLLEAMEAYEATHVWLPNFALDHLVRAVDPARRFDLSSLRAVICCSEPNRAETFDRMIARFGASGLKPEHLQSCYAMAETVFAISQSKLGSVPRRIRVDLTGGVVVPGTQTLISTGKPLAGVNVTVCVEGGLTTQEDRIGEICVSAPFLFGRYYPSQPPEKIDGYFRTGDLGFVRDGEIYISGRIKDLIIMNGRNFYAHDIEAVAGSVEGVKKGRCVAFGLDGVTPGTESIAIVAETEGEVAVQDVSRAVIDQLGISAAVIELVPPGWLQKTTSGKISRQENKSKYLATR